MPIRSPASYFLETRETLDAGSWVAIPRHTPRKTVSASAHLQAATSAGMWITVIYQVGAPVCLPRIDFVSRPASGVFPLRRLIQDVLVPMNNYIKSMVYARRIECQEQLEL